MAAAPAEGTNREQRRRLKNAEHRRKSSQSPIRRRIERLTRAVERERWGVTDEKKGMMVVEGYRWIHVVNIHDEGVEYMNADIGKTEVDV